MDDLIRTLAIWTLPVIFAITLHEAAHGYVARHFGDLTAYAQGRISLNPARHIDPVGTLLVPLLTLAIGGFFFGWAKPVPVNFSALRSPKRDMLWVAAAGPASNLAMAIAWGVLYKLSAGGSGYFGLPLQLMSAAGVMVNIALMLLNLLPVLPLDGGRILASLLPHRAAHRFSMLEPYGLWVMVGLIATGILGKILTPLMVLTIAGLSVPLGVSAVALLADASRF